MQHHFAYAATTKLFAFVVCTTEINSTIYLCWVQNSENIQIKVFQSNKFWYNHDELEQ